MKKSETQFWRRKAYEGKLINAIRSERERAVLFFGEDNVVNENQIQLLFVLDACEVLETSDYELALEVRLWSRVTEADLVGLPPNIQKNLLMKQKQLSEKVAEIKARARGVVELARKRRGA